jgi:hypothetical protein
VGIGGAPVDFSKLLNECLHLLRWASALRVPRSVRNAAVTIARWLWNDGVRP